jgi:uncharacterized protein (TIGR03435 family)
MAAFGQGSETAAKFEIADVHVAAPSNRFGVVSLVRRGRYELHQATMVDLVRFAYNVDAERVLGGPSWLEWDRFDMAAKGPVRASADTHRAMLRELLADRFKLVVRKDTKELPAYHLVAGKKTALKKATGSGESGCQFNFPPPGQSDGPPLLTYACRNVTMAAFAETFGGMVGMRQYLANAPVVDKTGLEGAWDFDFKYMLRAPAGRPEGDGITVFEAIDKQLGLKLEPVKIPLPVVIVESVNRTPSPNAPGVAESLKGGAAPTEFEVADVKPAPADFEGFRFQIQPGGRVNIGGMTLQDLITQAWDIRPDMLVEAPKWLNEARFSVVAKAPAASESTEMMDVPQFVSTRDSGPQVDFDTVRVMLQGLLKERFKLTMHEEERPLNAYTLLAVKPKMKTADPASRTRYTQGAAQNARPAAPGSRMITIQNMTMTQFASVLQRTAPGYFQTPVLDATGLDGSYDFTLTFAPAGAVRGGGGRGGKRGGPAADAPGAPGEPTDPTGQMSLPEAVERQLGLKLEQGKRPIKVWVIDHVERAPTEN